MEGYKRTEQHVFSVNLFHESNLDYFIPPVVPGHGLSCKGDIYWFIRQNLERVSGVPNGSLLFPGLGGNLRPASNRSWIG